MRNLLLEDNSRARWAVGPAGAPGAIFRIGPQGKALLAHRVVRKRLSRPAMMVLRKSKPVSGAYLVLAGRLRVFTVAPNGTDATLYFIDPGETCVLALNCLFNDLLYPAWVQAETTTTIAQIPGPVYRPLFESEPVIRNLTIQTLSTLVYRLMAELEQVHSSNHGERLAQFILLHAASDGSLRVTQQQVAHHLGTTREVVARLLGGFVAQGVLRTQRGSITIRDVVGLRRVVSPDARTTRYARRLNNAPANQGSRTGDQFTRQATTASGSTE